MKKTKTVLTPLNITSLVVDAFLCMAVALGVFPHLVIA